MESFSFVALARKAVFSASLLIVFVSLAGTKACREDYFFATQTSIMPTGTPTTEGDDDDDGGVITLTETPTPATTGSVTVVPTTTGTVAPTATPDGTNTVAAAQVALPLLLELGGLSENAQETPTAGEGNDDPQKDVKTLRARSGEMTNWLGQLYVDDSKSVSDFDRDGFIDELESELGTDPEDPRSFPSMIVTSLQTRILKDDADMDGLSDVEEQKLGTDPNSSDSDRDGVSDGAETLSVSDPLNPESIPLDRDSDGLSDSYEERVGLDPNLSDSDQDGLADDIEISIGSNPRNQDTDRDGILDGREYSQGSDPVRAERNVLFAR